MRCVSDCGNVSGMNRYSQTELQMSGPAKKGGRSVQTQRLSDPGRCPIDSVAMGTGVRAQMKGVGG